MANIQSGGAGAAQAANTVRRNADGYTDFRLSNVHEPAPVDGNATHDGTIGTTVTNALSDWDKLTKADANAITSAADTLAKQDKALVNKLLNTGK